ncbi:MAG: flippase-like domain-containing protein [Gammaproteobacteria bacterium]
MRFLSCSGLVAGLLVLVLLLIWGGIGEIIRLLVASGWTLLWLPVVWFPSTLVAALSWRLLFIPPRIPSFRHINMALWMGRSINTLLPVATIGGEIAKARLITLWGGNAIEASASVLVDKTVQAVSVIPWGIIGIVLLFLISTDHTIAYVALFGSSLLALGIIGFVLVQHAGMIGGLSSFLSRFSPVGDWTNINHHAREVDGVVREIYRNRGRVFMSVLWRTISLILETAEVWLACYLFNHTIGIPEALLIRSMVSLLNNMIFIIPNAYGIQEGGFILMGALVGLPPELSLAVSLATRIRELIIDLPGLLIWQFVESKRLLDRSRAYSP